MLSYAILSNMCRNSHKNISFDIQNPPKPLPKPSQILPKWSPGHLLAVSWALLVTKPEKKKTDNAPIMAKEVPNPCQNGTRMATEPKIA